jgi:deoxyribose-phosphate aldolase
MTIDLTRRFEALCVGPLITDPQLTANLTALAGYADRIYGVVVNLHQVPQAAQLVHKLGLGISIAPIAYPLGNLPLEIKILQARQALDAGAGGLDFVLPVEYLKSDTSRLVEDEIQALSELAGQYRAALTCIAPLGLLTPGEKQRAAALALETGAALKTATGLGTDTSREEVAGLRGQAGPDLVLVACGEIRLGEQAIDLLNAGATRICTPDLAGVFGGLAVLNRHGLLEV